jgi:hypothetical protein
VREGIEERLLFPRASSFGWNCQWSFKLNFFGRLVFSQAKEGGMTNDAFVGPIGEFHLRDQLWFDPVDAAQPATVSEGSE